MNARTATLVPFGLALALGACDCSDAGGLPGPSSDRFSPVAAASVEALQLTPFDVDRQDLVGPDSHSAQYGKTPEIVVSPGLGRIEVALRSFDAEGVVRALVLRFEDQGSGLVLTRALEAPSLGLLLGFVAAPDGGFFYATGTEDEDVSSTYPAEGAHRRNVVRVYRVDADGEILFDVDLDHARGQLPTDSEPIVNPGVAASARLGLAGNQLALVHGNNTAPDPDLDGTRHQKALTTILDATTGAITDANGIWCSHSFDQRYLSDGDDLYELHLGDAYPRQIVVSRIRGGMSGGGTALYRPKGTLGNNNTFTRLGGIARIDSGSGSGGFLALFASERTTDTTSRVNGSRDLALVRTVPDFASGAAADALDTGFGTTFDVVSAGSNATNRVLWLTSFHEDAPGTMHAERPKLLPLSGGQFLVLFERWSSMGLTSPTFDGTYAMRIDGSGAVLASATQVSTHHLPRGDDAFVYEGEGCWVTGDSVVHTLTLHCVAPDLSATQTLLP